MCIFTGPVEQVARTEIFARGSGGRQWLAYAMTLAAPREVGMVLPLPVPPRSPEDAVRFVDLQPYAHFFRDLEGAFPRAGAPLAAEVALAGGTAPTLAVQQVGAFEASFVPSPRDFPRLDPRFRIPPGAWRRMPRYADFGFAVFKLRPGRGPTFFHPMAFEFPRRDPDSLFFPTVHVHDGERHAEAEFGHVLYAQFEDADAFPDAWEPSRALAHRSVDLRRAGGLVDGDRPLHRLRTSGRHANEDVRVERTALDLVTVPASHGRRAGSRRQERARLQEALSTALGSDPASVEAALVTIERSPLRVAALPALTAALSGAAPGVRGAIARVLEAMGERELSPAYAFERALDSVDDLLRRGDASQAGAALETLGRLAPFARADHAERFVSWMDAPDGRFRSTVLRLLATVLPVSPAAADRALSALAGEEDSDRREAQFAIVVRGGARAHVVTALAGLLDSPRWALRKLACRSLGQLGPGAKAAVPALRRMAAGLDVELADEAREALARIGG